MLCALRREVKKSVEDSPYYKGSKNSTASDDQLSSLKQSVQECRGVTTVELSRKDGSTLGLTVSGGTDKDATPRVSKLRPGALAARSDQLNVGDYITSVNGIHLARLRQEEIISLLKNVGERVVLEVEYELPPAAPDSSSDSIPKIIDIRLRKKDNSCGFVMRGGFHEEWRKSRPLVVTYVRPGGPADREGTMHVGDRILSVDGMPVHNKSHTEALSIIMGCGPEVLLQVEYDVATVGTMTGTSGPRLVEIEKPPGASLGISLASAAHRDKQVIAIEKIKAASAADRCGALRVGDHVLSINGTSTEHCSVLEAARLISSSTNQASLEILPSRPRETVKVQRSEQHHCWDPCVSYCHGQHPGQCKAPWGGTSNQASQEPCRSSSNMSPASTSTSGLGSQPSCPAPRPISPACSILPTSPHSSMLSRRQRVKEHKSSLSLASSTVAPGGQIVHPDTCDVTILGDPLNGFGLQLQGGVFTIETLSAPPVIRSIAPHSPAERCGLLQAGDRLLSINGILTEDGTLEDATQLLRDAALTSHVTLGIEFDVAESVVPSSGTFNVKLPRKRGVDLGITLSASKRPGQPLIISDVRKGSIAQRTGTLEPGDKLLAIDNVRLENCTMDDALQLLQQSDDLVKLKIQKDEDNADEQDMSGCIIYTVELQRFGGPLGITISGTEEPFDPIVISGLSKRGLAERTGAIHIGDRILALNGVSLKGKPLSEAIHLLQMAGETVTLKIKKQINELGTEGKKSELTNDLADDDNSQKSTRLSEIYSGTIPSVDSAMESWDGSGSSTDVGGGGLGTHTHLVSDVSLELDKWHRTTQNNNALPAGGCKKCPISNEEFSNNNWDKPSGDGLRRLQSNLALDQQDMLWCQALEDLETCGQSELLREIEASIMSGSTFSLDMDSHKSHDLVNPLRMSNAKNNNFLIGCESAWMPDSIEEGLEGSLSLTALELLKVTIMKDLETHDFGFSISDGYLQSGIYVNMVRPEGPADKAGLKPFDHILQVNHVRTSDSDCCLAVPLITDTGDKLELVISRNPLVPATPGQFVDCEDPSATQLNARESQTHTIHL
ncbi:glutamate receptor-interacting protein 2-like isoform X2 [Brienomyrus brachyistius]|uniref:glutamate receptor-interacting protein 2-like isoform X2 n=1 Tax=Brienomyrus brachyistius TaxID=42636 RepID=UPI0020B44E12|nr:glutamate receptor-interacting protein 2-like isoform X2 [Brienomyrus brachyistius]